MRERDLAMYRRILVAVDETDSARRAAREATVLARDTAAALRFVHVAEDPSQADAVLSPIAAIARRAGVDSEEAVLPSNGDAVADVILREAAHWHADLIVIGSHGRQGLERLLFGSIAEAVVGAADVPVLVVREATLGILAS
jgi:nucleotide-binding universal stress UspA family protein